MSTEQRTRFADEIGRGPLSRGAAAIYRMLVLEAQLALASAPTIVALLVLDRDASNLPLFVIALLPITLALVAGVAAVRAAGAEPDLSPGRHFIRAYRRDATATLTWAAPAHLVLALLTFNLVHLDAVDGGNAMRPLLLVVALLIVVWSGHMLVLTAGFRLRTRDAARIALAGLLPQWRFSLGVLALLVVAVFTVLAGSEVLLLLLLWAFAGLLALMARPVFEDVKTRFTAA